MKAAELLRVLGTVSRRPWRIQGFRIVTESGRTLQHLEPYDWAAPGIASVAIMNHADALVALLAAEEQERDAVCTTQVKHWDYVEDDRNGRLCFLDIHSDVCPVTAARKARAAALAAVHAVGDDHG